MFPFPSNGKVHRKSVPISVARVEFYVSIPFKRESASQANTASRADSRANSNVSIPFKRESASQVQAKLLINGRLILTFQFPSNGKVHRKLSQAIFVVASGVGFNSLQTGKCIARLMKCSKMKREHCFNSLQTGKCIASIHCLINLSTQRRVHKCFNSLQTGKCIASLINLRSLPAQRDEVSIPFKRESASQETPF